jgi:thiamine-triphosphatase
MALQSLFKKLPLLPVCPTSAIKTLEVERKFLPTNDSIARLRANSGKPVFRFHQALGIKHTHDIYYDREGILMSKGIYVRLRDGQWEAKVRQGGDYTNSRFAEYQGHDDVGHIVKDVFSTISEESGSWKKALVPVADLKTKREEWDADGFRICVDEVDQEGFEHRVGEVELCEEIEVDETTDEETIGKEMDERIEKFMKEHEWAFPATSGKVVGKLSAYFLWKNSLCTKKRKHW